MPFWLLATVIISTWLLYPIVGAIGVAASVATGDSPEDAGFSFLPELILYPPIFFGIAVLIDSFTNHIGSFVVAGVSAAMIVWMAISTVQNLLTIRQHRKNDS